MNDTASIWRPRAALVLTALALVACGNQGDDGAPPPWESALPGAVERAPAAELLPEQFEALWQPWYGDIDRLVQRRIIRVVVPYGGYQYYYENGEPRGAILEMLRRFEDYINDQYEMRHLRIHVVVIPASRDQLIPDLVEGHADLIAADLTITEPRSVMLRFTRPLMRGIDEVVVSGPNSPPLTNLEDLSGQPVFVRKSSSYFEHLRILGENFKARGIDPPEVIAIDELLEAEDILEMVNGGILPLTVMDDYKADFWSSVFPDLRVHKDLVINANGSIAWAVNRQSEEFGKFVDGFLRKFGRGTLIGNDIYNRNLADADQVRCATSATTLTEARTLTQHFRRFGQEYDFDWLMLAAQGFQESGLEQSKKSPAGAIGIMQIKPSTAADPNVGIDDISSAENNIRAGSKYLRFIADRYFDDMQVDKLNQWLLSLAAYNAGPARIARLRREAREAGYDPNQWFDNVEIIAAKRIGRETVEYVSNVFKYYVGYRVAMERSVAQDALHGSAPGGCLAGTGD